MTKNAQASSGTTHGRHTETGAHDSDVLAGDMPPRPAWPLVLGVGVWVLWIGFLLVMMVVRMRTTAV